MQKDKINTISIFNELAADYWLTDYFSFGLTKYIRLKSLLILNPEKGETVCDAMCGTGNNFNALTQKNCTVIAIDNSPKMIDLATRQINDTQINIRTEDFLNNTLENNSIDKLICTFGIKCLHPADYTSFVHQLTRIIKPGGSFVISDIFLKTNLISRLPVLLYIKYVVPAINYLFTHRNPHRYLFSFTSETFDIQLLCRHLKQENVQFHVKSVGLKHGVILYGKIL